MKLYHFPHSPNTRKVLAVIHHLGLDTELEMVNLVTGEQMKPEFIRLNPNPTPISRSVRSCSTYRSTERLIGVELARQLNELPRIKLRGI